MKRIEIIVLFIFMNSLIVFGQQSTYVLTINTPDKIEDTFLYWSQVKIGGINLQEENYGQNTSIQVNAWTFDAIPILERGLIKFDLEQLPANIEIVKAELSLYHFEYNINQYQPMSNLSGSNEVNVQRVTSNWVENEVTWNTQPTTTNQNQVILPESSTRNQDYIDIDVTKLVNEMVLSGVNYGFMLKLATEEYFRSMFFCSSENENSNMRPKLVIEYKIAATKQAPISNVRKISATQGGFSGKLDAGDLFGSQTVIGDIDGDGNEDMAVGAIYDDDGATNAGAVYILFMNNDRTVRNHQKISALEGNFHGVLENEDVFGCDVAPIGDMDGDGHIDIAVSNWGDDDIGINSGAVWIFFLNADGTVKKHQKISATQGGLVGLTSNRLFGSSVTSLGDLNGDGVTDIAVGSPAYDNEGGLYKGCVWILFLNSNGTVKSQQKINDYQGGFTGKLDNSDYFGGSVENIGDINGDRIVDIAVWSIYDDDGASNSGAFYILFLNTNGTIKHTQKISAVEGGFRGTIASEDRFGVRIVSLGDIDGDGINDLLTGSSNSDEGGVDKGKAWIIYLNSDATVKDYNEINYQSPALTGLLDNGDIFGTSVSVFVGLNDNGKKEIVISARGDDDGATDAGAVYIMDLDVKHKPIAVAGNNQTMCEGDTLVIDGSGSSVLDNDELSYSWVCSNYVLTNSSARSFTFKTPVVAVPTRYQFILTVYCQGLPSAADTVNVTVNPKPAVPVISQSQGIITSSIGYQYYWYFNNSEIARASDRTYTPVNDGDYQVVVTSSFGCFSQKSNILNVLVKPVAVANGKKTVCSGTEISLDGTSSYAPYIGSSGLKYKWKCNDMVVPGDTFAVTSLIAPKVDKTIQKVFILQVFRGELTSETDTLLVNIIPAPQTPTIKQFGDTLLSSRASNYQWYKEGKEIDGANDSTLFISRSGNYRVKTMNTQGCVSDISDAFHVIYSSVNEYDYKIKVFPNPTTGIVSITGMPLKKGTKINVYNNNAQLLLSTKSDNGSAGIDFSGLNPGQYLIVIDNDHQRAVKIMKH